jgi:predicted N-acetyltransferase YhbS
MAKRKRRTTKPLEVGHVTCPADRREARELSVGVFSGFWESVDREQRERTPLPDEMIRICSKDGKIVTHAALIDKKMRVGSAAVRLCGVGGVSTHPKHRHEGCALAVMRDAIDFMKKKGYAVSMLFSGAHELYRKCGYEGAVPEFRAEIRVGRAKKAGGDGSTRKARLTDISAMSRLYELCNRNRTGSMLRPLKDWQISLKHGTWLLAEKDGRAVAYARFNKRWSRGGKLRVDDCAAENGSAARTLMAALGRRAAREDFDVLDIMGPPDHPVISEAVMLGGNFNWGRGEYQMMRIIDLGRLLSGIARELEQRLRASELAGGKLTITFKTDIGSARLDINSGTVAVSSAPEGKRQGSVVKIPQKFLMQLVMGYRPVAEVTEEDGVRMPKASRRLLEVLFPVGYAHVWHVDRF